MSAFYLASLSKRYKILRMASAQAAPDLDIVLPVHNEAESIETTLREIHEELSPRLRVRFVICEDGSRDGTPEVLRRLSAVFPMKLETSEARKGYSRAVVDAFKMSEAPFVLALDSDGQCDPKDFWSFWEIRDRADVIIGWRVHRSDALLRKLMSGAFRAVHAMLFHPGLHDPSCPYLLIHKRVLDRLIPELGVLEQGFWWEFVARVCGRGFRMQELPVRHRERAAGSTRVYTLSKIPGIAWRHLWGLLTIRRQLKLGDS